MACRFITLFVTLLLTFSSRLAVSEIRIIRGETISVHSVPVVKIVGVDSSGEYLCSGALISSKVVLTASHCMANSPADMTVYFRGSSRRVSSFRIHPGVRENSQSGIIVNDVALLFLSRPVHGRYFSILKSHVSKAGDSIDIYGFGVTETGSSGGLRRGNMLIDSTDKNFVYARYDGTLSNTCNGDSGGPAVSSYIDNQGNSHTGIVAITSGGENENCGPGDISYFSRTQNSSTYQFLKRHVKGLSVK